MNRSSAASLLLSAVPFVLSPAVVCADEVHDGQRIHQAVLRLRDDTFARCATKFELSGVVERDGVTSSQEKGTVQFARFESCVWSDAAVIKSVLRAAGETRSEPAAQQYIQYYMANGRRCVSLRYDMVKAGKRLRTVACDPRRDYDDSFRALTKSVHLTPLLSNFDPSKESLVEITKSPPASVTRDAAGRLTGVYPTVYGPVRVSIERRDGQDVVSEASVKQGPTDVYTHQSGGSTLSQVADSVLDDTPEGLTSVTRGLTIVYAGARPGRPFASLVIVTEYNAKDKRWKSSKTLTLSDYKRCTGEADIEALRLPIPEGQAVNSIDPEFKSLALAYRCGEIVRQVDEASLDEVIVEKGRRRTSLYLLSGVAAAVVLAVLVRAVRRKIARPAVP
jgi:hypothetical protein